jgi:hypothetical protein
MASELQDGMQCVEFDAFLADALDGTLGGTNRIRFDAHRASCASCAAMFGETQAGLNWLQALPEVDPPAGFAERILLATSGVQSKAKAEQPEGWMDRVRGKLAQGFRPVWTTVMQPRFAMSFGMAFFSITLLLNVAGLKISSLKSVDLRPSALVRTYYEASGRVVRYYENIRFVYELETRVRELKRAATPVDEKPDQKKDQQQDKKQGNEPDQRNYQNYSQDDSRSVLADGHGCKLVDPWFPTQRRLS